MSASSVPAKARGGPSPGFTAAPGPSARQKIWLFLAFVLVTALVLGAGTASFVRLRDQIRRHVQNELATIAEQKRQQIEQLLQDMATDVALFSEGNALVAENIERWLHGRQVDGQLRDTIRQWLEDVAHANRYATIALFDASGRTLLAIGDHDVAHHAGDAITAIRDSRPISVDLHHNPSGSIDFGIISPVSPQGRPPLAALYFAKNAADQLYPLVERWPIPTKTAETYLVRRDANAVFFLSPLRHGTHAELSFSRPLDTPRLAAATAVRGNKGVYRGRDYRGEPVLAYTTPVMGSTWAMVAEMDESEAEGAIRVTGWNTALITLLTLGLAYLAGYGLWRHQLRRQQLSLLEERLAGEERLAALASNVNAILWEADIEGVQAAALSASVEPMLGYPLASWNEPRAWLDRMFEQDQPRVLAALNKARQGEEVVVEYRVRHQAGHIVWIEDRFSLQQDAAGNPCLRGVAFDVTARKDAERALQLTQHSIDQSGDALFWVREDGRICLVNDAACRSLGYTRDELLQLTVMDIDANNQDQKWPQRWQALKRRPVAPPPFESRQRARDGREFPVEVSAHFVDFKGEQYVCAFVRDITERKHTEAELARYRGQLEQMVAERTTELEQVNRRLSDTVFALESVGTAIHQVDAATGQLLYVNRAAATMLGYTAEEMQRLRVTEIDADFQNPTDYARIAATILANGFLRFETTQRHKDGRRIPVEMTVYSQPAAAGVPQRFIAFGVDISERLAARQALERSEEQLRLALAAGQIGTFDWNLETDESVCSQWHNRLWGYPDGEGIRYYADYLSRIHPDDRPVVEAALERSREGRSRYGAEYRVLWPDGSEHWISETGEYRYDEDGRAIRMYGTVLEISERKLAEAAKEQALAAAENLARLRQEFLANMSHELRTPLNGVLGFAQIGIRNYGDAAKARNAFEKILQSGNHLLGVVNDILDFSKIEQGKLIVESVPVDLCQIIDEAVGHVREQAAAKQLALRVDKTAGFLRIIQSDPLRLRQILGNLLSNAVKFTDAGGIVLSVRMEDRELILDVSDTGIGITEDHLARLFEPFEQADGSFTRKYGGSGLGLAITCRLVELMGGSIRVDSEVGAGSRFTVRLPLREGSPDQASLSPTRAYEGGSTDEHALARLRVLVAEDNEINQFVVNEILSSAGAQVTLANDGAQAVQCVIDEGPGAYDLVMMDLQMPEMNGFEATERIKAIAPDLPVVALTAHTLQEEKDRCDAAGMAGHIAKPFLPSALIDAVRTHARGGSDERAHDTPSD